MNAKNNVVLRWCGAGLTISTLILGFFIASVSLPAAAEQSKKSKTYPATIMIIRHGEKPEEKLPHLSGEGKKRAEALPHLFEASKTRPEPFPTPDFIFAASNSKNSERPLETVTPLAKHLKLTVNASFNDEEPAKIVHELFENPKYAGKTVLIAWRHGKIIPLVKELKVTDAPDHWKETVFDRVWQIGFDEHGKTTFRDLPQNLMLHDSAK